jgi:carboxymethylenebutenolidase
VRLPWLAAAVPFYGGSQPAAAEAAKIKAAVMIHNAAKDDWVNAGAPACEQALQAAGVRHEAYTYAGSLHSFHNDTTPRHDEAAARLGWQRTVAFFNRELRG